MVRLVEIAIMIDSGRLADKVAAGDPTEVLRLPADGAAFVGRRSLSAAMIMTWFTLAS